MARQKKDLTIPVVRKSRWSTEIGRTGLRYSGGYIQEESQKDLRQLQERCRRIDEMRTNSADIKAAILVYETTLRQTDRRVEPFSDNSEDRVRAAFVEECLDDLDRSQTDFFNEVYTYLWYGFAIFEQVFKTRNGWKFDSSKSSRFNDGAIGWAKFGPRAQESVSRWDFDDFQQLVAVEQTPAPDYIPRLLPAEKLLHFRTTTEKDNPEGQSLLRAAWFDWYFFKRLTEIGAIGAERDLAGIPLIKAPAELFSSSASTAQQATLAELKKIGESVHVDEQHCVLMPQYFDPETKQPLYEFSLIGSAGSKQFDVLSMIQAHERRMFAALGTDFILMGHEEVGTYSLMAEKTKFFAQLVDAILIQIADVFNRVAIPRLAVLNGWPMDRLPRMTHGSVQKPDLEMLAKMLTAYTGAGGVFDPALDVYLRETLDWPASVEEPITPREQMEQQAEVAEEAAADAGSDEGEDMEKAVGAAVDTAVSKAVAGLREEIQALRPPGTRGRKSRRVIELEARLSELERRMDAPKETTA